MKTWAFIPARGGSDSIPLKNMAVLGEAPLINWVLTAACLSNKIDKVIVSTDSETIKGHIRFKFALSDRVEIADRPSHLTDGISYPVVEVLREYLSHIPVEEHPDAIAFFQPTSPFVSQKHITSCIDALEARLSYNSVQTVTEVAHNSHWVNQRVLQDFDTKMDFMSPVSRKLQYNKGKKSPMYKFGNLIITRTKAIIEEGLFSPPSYPVIISNLEAFDIDTEDDLKLANAAIQGGLIG